MNHRNILRKCLILVVLTLSSFTFSQAIESLLLPPLQWRCISPNRGGRSIAVAGHKDRPFEYYFGATGGGLWKTTDGDVSWYPVTDGQIRSSSVGAVAVVESNPEIVYLGMGESQLRQNVLQGDGVYKSTDGGQTWEHIGLEESQVISRIRIHPSDPNRVYIAALGHPFGPNPERGPWAPPGRYQIRLVVDGKEQKRGFNVKKAPRLIDVTDADLRAQFDLALKIRDKESAANKGVILIRNLKAQVEDRMSKTDDRNLRKTAREFVRLISAVEKELYQVKNQSPKDKIAFPTKLNDRLTGLRSHPERGDGPPTKVYDQVFEELSAELTIQLQVLKRLLRESLPRLNEELDRLGLDRIKI